MITLPHIKTIITPEGLIFHIYGAEVGLRHDMTLYRQRYIETVLSYNLVIGGWPFYVFGYPVYILRPWIKVGIDRAFATTDPLLHKKCMSYVR